MLYFFTKTWVFFLFLIINDTRASFIYILSFIVPLSDNLRVIRINKTPGSRYLTPKHLTLLWISKGFPSSSASKESGCNAVDPGSIPGLGRTPGEGVGYTLQHSWAALVAQMVKNLTANAGNIRDVGLIPGLGRSPEEGHGNPLR